jgi:EcsC protein family
MNQVPPFATKSELTQADRAELLDAMALLERPTIAARIADYAGQPVNAVTKIMPGAFNRVLRHAVRGAMYQCLQVAVGSLSSSSSRRPSEWSSKIVTGLTGGIGGFFGLAALPVELPVTTTLMLRSIAEVARANGEDIGALETKLACLEVFALGGRSAADKSELDYYAVRAVITKLTGEMAAYIMERGAINASSPIVVRLVGEIAGRFGLMISERIAAGAVPFIGAVGGATVNMVFMDHFQRVARGHFTIRRLERKYDTETIKNHYHREVASVVNGKRLPRLALGQSS